MVETALTQTDYDFFSF